MDVGHGRDVWRRGGKMNIRLRRATVGLCLMLGLLFTPAQAAPLVRLANGEWPPYQSEFLPHYGFASHVVQEAFKAVGIDVEYAFFPWSRALNNALQGRDEDGHILNGTLTWARTPEREASYLFSDVVFEDSEVLFYTKDNPVIWSSVEDLRGKVLGGVTTTVYLVLDEAEKNGILTIERSTSYASLFKRLLYGRVDALPMLTQVGRFYIQTVLSEEERQRISSHPKVTQVRRYHLLLLKKIDENRELMLLFNQGLAAIRANGTYERLLTDLYVGRYDQNQP